MKKSNNIYTEYLFKLFIAFTIFCIVVLLLAVIFTI